MLEGLDAVLWSELDHAYGPATDVPVLLRKLTSTKPVDWVGAIDQLYGTIFHQGTLYDSTPPAIPFLIELLDCPPVKCRGKIMLLLADMVQVPWSDIDEEDRQQAGTYELDEDYIPLLHATYAAVWTGWKTYLLAGSDIDPRLRVTAPRLLAEMSATPLDVIASVIADESPHQEITATLRRWFEEEPNPVVQASILMALGKWTKHDPTCLLFIRQQLDDNEHEVTPVRLAATMALAEHPEPPRDALDVFVAVLENPDICKDIFSAPHAAVEDRHDPVRRAMKGYLDGPEAVEELDRAGDDSGVDEDFRYPWVSWVTLGSVLGQMSRLSPRDCQSLAEPLVRLLTTDSTFSIWAAKKLLRKAVFHDVDLRQTQPSDLTQPQYDILSTLFDDPECWATRVVNTQEDIEAMGVPYDRKELARLLGCKARVTSPEKAERHLLRLLRSEARGSKGAPRPEEPVTKDHFHFLERLSLRSLGSDPFMPLLDRFPGLKELEIGAHTSDRGLAMIGDLPCLKEIWLNAHITDNGFLELLRFSTLERVFAIGSRVTAAAASVIARLPHIKEFSGIPLTDAGLHAIADAGLPLEKLHLQQAPITDASVDALATLPRLWILHAEGTGITESGVSQLQKALPDCRIYT